MGFFFRNVWVEASTVHVYMHTCILISKVFTPLSVWTLEHCCGYTLHHCLFTGVVNTFQSAMTKWPSNNYV